MARSNSPSSMENWKAKSPKAVYRASIGPNAVWDTDRPRPDLAVAAKVSPGGRMLMAFEMKEIRDYFVEGHADQEAQVEPDGAERASPRRTAEVHAFPKADDLAASIRIYSEARALLNEAHDAIERAFNDEFARLFDAGRAGEAISLLRIMPDTHLRSSAIMRLQDAGWNFDANPIWKAAPTAYTREQAVALVQWQRASMQEASANEAFAKFAMERVQEILDEEGREAAEAFGLSLPGSVTKAFVMDRARYGKPREADEGSQAPRM